MTPIFQQSFPHIFNKDDKDIVEMGFNPTFLVQSKHQQLCTLKWLLQLGKLFSQASWVLIQIMMHYQYSLGQQYLHVMTVACNCAEAGSSSIAALFDQGAAAALMARIAVFKGEINDLPDVLHWLDGMLIWLFQKFANYWKEDPATLIQPTLMSYTFDIPPQPVFLDSISIKADVVLLDMFFHILIFHGEIYFKLLIPEFAQFLKAP
ncbi:hypothetical protein EDC04DRAFT_2893644 [Pisolithus marmoratus]|nr:hypothetical protein EDC04DRAFT_2893644 [Pisolithus marmoratus]